MLLFPLLFSIFLLLSGYSKGEIDESQDEGTQLDELLKDGNGLAVLFTEECCACTNCVEAEVLLGGMSKELEDNLDIFVVRLKSPELKKRFGVKRVPTLVYIRENKTALYSDKFEFETLYTWLQDNRQPATVELDDSSFEHLTQASTGATTGDWLVIFHNGSCCKKRELMHLETAGIQLRNKVNVASVDILKSPETKERFKITSCPQVIFFHHQRLYKFTLADITSRTLKSFAEGFYKNSKAETVPSPPSYFDKILDRSLEFYLRNYKTMLAVLALTTVTTTVFLICCGISPLPGIHPDPHTKSD